MMWWYYGNGMQWFGPLMMVIFWVAILVFAAWLFRTFARPHAQRDSAMDALRTRLASGQITAEEFESTRKLLEG